MSDLEKFIDLYKQFGIDLVQNKNIHDNVKIRLKGPGEFATRHEKLQGYDSCFSDLEFTKDGEFIKQSFWED